METKKVYQKPIFSISIILLITISIASYLLLPLSEPPQTDSVQTEKASFINLGQTEGGETKDINKYAHLSPEELMQKADEIIAQANILVAADPNLVVQLSEEERKNIDTKVTDLEKRIQTLEQNLKK